MTDRSDAPMEPANDSQETEERSPNGQGRQQNWVVSALRYLRGTIPELNRQVNSAAARLSRARRKHPIASTRHALHAETPPASHPDTGPGAVQNPDNDHSAVAGEPVGSPATVPAQRRPLPWDAIGAIAAVAGLIAGVVFGATELFTRLGDEPEAPVVPVDERLELVDIAFTAEPLRVTVLEYLPPGDLTMSVSPYPERPEEVDGDHELQHALLVVLRNPADDPAVLTGLKLIVHEVLHVAGCGAGPGGGVVPSLNFSFRFPNSLTGTWEGYNRQHFSVPPHEVDALSVTMGPEFGESAISLWRFSVYGVSAGGKEAHWGSGFSMQFGPFQRDPKALSDIQSIDYREYIVGESEAIGAETIRRCAALRADDLETFTSVEMEPDVPFVMHPGIPGLIASYREIGEG